MKIYLAGSIRGGQEKINDYKKICKILEKYGQVLTPHVADNEKLDKVEEMNIEDIYKIHAQWLRESDLIVADVSIHSTGVGYELGLAESLGKRVICLYDLNSEKANSAMIAGDKYFQMFNYKKIEEAVEFLDNELSKIKKK